MNNKRIKVSSRNGNGVTSGAIIIKSSKNIKEVKAVVFSSCEAKILNVYIDKMKNKKVNV